MKSGIGVTNLPWHRIFFRAILNKACAVLFYRKYCLDKSVKKQYTRTGTLNMRYFFLITGVSNWQPNE